MGIPTPQKKKERIGELEKIFSGLKSSSPDQLKSVLLSLANELKIADYEASYTHDGSYLEQLKKYYKHFWAAYKSKTRATDDESPVQMTVLGETKVIPTKSPEQERQEEQKRRMEELKKQEEQQKKDAEAAQQRLKEAAEREARIKKIEVENAAKEKIKKEEQAYEQILEKLVGNPKSVTDADLKDLGDKVKDLKQEAENRISKLPRQERDLKLALIRGDSLSPKTFTEIKETSIGLHGSLQKYIEEVNKIPSSSVIAVNNMGSGRKPVPIYQVDPDRIDMAS